MAVVVVISRADTHAIPCIADTCLRCYFLELPIAPVSIQGVLRYAPLQKTRQYGPIN